MKDRREFNFQTFYFSVVILTFKRGTEWDPPLRNSFSMFCLQKEYCAYKKGSLCEDCVSGFIKRKECFVTKNCVYERIVFTIRMFMIFIKHKKMLALCLNAGC